MRNESLEILETLKELDAKDQLHGCYSDIPIDVYHHPECPGYSSTIIKRIAAQSYNHWFVSKDEEARSLEFGSAFHCFVNEPHLFSDFFHIAQTSSRMTGEWKAIKKAVTDKTILTLEDFECLKIMASKLFEHPDIAPYMKGATFEHTYFARDVQTGLLKKCRTDILSNGIVFDLKSCVDASREAFAREMKKRYQRISSSYYLEVVSEATGVRHDVFRLVACEKSEPHEIKVYNVPEASIQKAQPEIRAALETIKNILEHGASAWRGYTLGAEDLYI